MQESTIPEDLEIPDELTTLKSRADQLGLHYHPSIGLDKLREKVLSKLDGKTTEEAGKTTAPVVLGKETDNEFRLRKRKEASELVRVHLTCMNPQKKEWDGEIIAAGNTVVGTFKKYVPFNVDEGYHIPRIIYNQLVQRKCQIFHSVKDHRGNTIRVGKLIREFAITILPPLTSKELHELAQRQAMSKSIG